MTGYYTDQDEQGMNGFDKQAKYKAEMLLERAVPALRSGAPVSYGTREGNFVIIHLGLGESTPVKIPISAMLKCRSVEDMKQLIETQYAIEKMT